MRIIITGGAGCLGSNLIEKLLPKGYEILVIDNFATGKREVVPLVGGLRVVEGSVADGDLIDRCFDEFSPEVVIHSAAAYKDPEDWEEDAVTNVIGSIHVAKAAARVGVRRIINFQTALCYGRPERTPIPADHPERPFTSYGISKTAGERYLINSGLPVISLRLANVTGPRLAIGPIPTFYQRLKAGKSCFCSDTRRDFLDMEDFISIMEIVMKNEAPSGVFNVSTGESRSILDVFDVVSSYLGIVPDAPPPVVPPGSDDVPDVVLDPSETEKVLGWKAQVGFEETIRRMLAWYDEHGVSAIHSHLAEPKS
ncbi:MAG: NAD-dependent epimerase/dehydratase family protein [Verrucomicrobia bacterium]|nr:NAD-dependent epimerase/dehydratase family protein [Verrucomicrobiota bacterium]MDA1047922.1 NAD-dependent epimerase/dehydratase family protein [Verrucomicrobiota bacterium]